jgi:hypothetical protein
VAASLTNHETAVAWPIRIRGDGNGGPEAAGHGLDMEIVNHIKIYTLYKIHQEEVESIRKLIFRHRLAGDWLPSRYGPFCRNESNARHLNSPIHCTAPTRLPVEDKGNFAIITSRNRAAVEPTKIHLKCYLKMRWRVTCPWN